MDVASIIMKSILLLVSFASVVVLSVRLYVNQLKGDEKVIYILGLASQVSYVFLMVLQILNISGLANTRDLIHAIGPEVDILLIGYLFLITFYYSPRSVGDYIHAIKVKKELKRYRGC